MLIVAMVALLGFVAIVASMMSSTAAPDYAFLEARAAAKNMLLYKQAATMYYAANPSATGVVTDASLGTYLPAGYTKHYDWTANINGGYAYVYTTDLAAASATAIAKSLSTLSDDSFLTGRKVGSNLVSSSRGDTGIVLPAFVPNGSPVSMGK